MGVEQGVEVDVLQLVAVQREEGARLFARGRGEAQSPAASERLGLADRNDLRAEPAQLCGEQRLLATRAADDDPLDAGADELRHLVLGERVAAHRHERLRLPPRGLAEPRRLAACEDDRFHYCCGTRGSGSGISGNAAKGEDGRPMPS